MNKTAKPAKDKTQITVQLDSRLIARLYRLRQTRGEDLRLTKFLEWGLRLALKNPPPPRPRKRRRIVEKF